MHRQKGSVNETLYRYAYENPKNWERWFAWYPVYCGKRLVWLTHCYRLIYVQPHYKLWLQRGKIRGKLVCEKLKRTAYKSKTDFLLHKMKYVGD